MQQHPDPFWLCDVREVYIRFIYGQCIHQMYLHHKHLTVAFMKWLLRLQQKARCTFYCSITKDKSNVLYNIYCIYQRN